MKKTALILTIATLGFASADGATLVWNFTDLNATVDLVDGAAATPGGVGAFGLGNSLGTVTSPVNNTSPSGVYAGASGGGNIGNAVKIGAFDAANSSYYTLTLTPNTGVSVVVSDLDFGSRSTGTGPVSFAIRSSVDNFASDVAAATGLANSAYAFLNTTFSASITGLPGVPVEVRVYTYGGTGSPTAGVQNSRIDDIAVVATGYSNVPEPATAVSLIGGLGLLCGFRRIRDRRAAANL